MSTWNWKRGLLGAGFVLAGGCNLGDLVDEEALFKGVKVPTGDLEAFKKIGEMGGQVVTQNGAVSIPEGALSSDEEITIQQADPEKIPPLPSVMKPISAPVHFGPDGTQFAEPVTVSLFHDKSANEPEEPMVVWLEDEKDPNWKTIKEEDTQTDDGVTYVSTDHFSIYAVVDCTAAGPLAHLCQDLVEGKITVKEVLEMVGEAEDAWGGVVTPPPDDGEPDPEPDPGTSDYDCRRCLEIAQKCQQDPRQAICEEAAEPCSKLAPECAGELTCSQLQSACNADLPGACDEFDRRCGGGPVLGRCDQLSLDCDRGNRGACDAFERECGVDVGPDCPKLSAQCEGGDQAACQDFYDFCGGTLDDCELAALACERGDQNQCQYHADFCAGDTDDGCALASDLCAQQDQHACELYDHYCVQGLPPVSTCQGHADACYVGIAEACGFNDSYCYAGELQCEQAYAGCYELGDSDACDAYSQDCEGGQVDECEQAALDCDAGNTDACSFHEAFCAGGGASDEDCLSASEMCRQGDTHACDLYDFYCTGTDPQVDECQGSEDACYVGNQSACDFHAANCSSDGGSPDCYGLYYEQCNGPEANVQACYDYDACMGNDTDPNCHYERTCYPAGCEGDVCWPEQCSVQTVCNEPPPPPEVCEPLWNDCQQNNNQAACDEAYTMGCPPPGGAEPGDAGVPPAP